MDSLSALNNLDFSYNHIEFTTIEFISFVEGLKIYDINSIGIEGNSFLKKNPRLQHNYRTFMYATLDNLFILDEEKRPIDNENLNPNEIRAQMLIEDKEINKTMEVLINDPLRTFSVQENQRVTVSSLSTMMLPPRGLLARATWYLAAFFELLMLERW